MKKRAFTSFISILFAVMALSQPSLLWESSFNGAVANDQGNAIAIDGSGNVYVAGATDETSGASDYLTIKYNANGDILWSRTYNGAANGLDEALAIKVDAAGNVYVTGRSQGTGSAFNIVTIKYNSDGVQQWAVVINNGLVNIGNNLVVDPFGNVYVAGGNNAYNGHIIVK
ncbi:MAG: SBBP repeat-containing protein [Lewinellaceae bacterium]|nr:SBBP repeat-containing protein [Lewinellaceae bacterium]